MNNVSDVAIPRGYALRPLQPAQPGELDLVVSRSMQTVLDTIPEFGGSEEKAREHLPNFSHEAMRAMYQRDLERPASHRLVVLQTEKGEIVGHAIYFVRGLGEASPIGYLFTIYVAPLHRRHGLAKTLLTDALSWSEDQGAVRVVAHTHVTNLGLVRLAERCGFKITERSSAPPWPHLTLERATPTR